MGLIGDAVKYRMTYWRCNLAIEEKYVKKFDNKKTNVYKFKQLFDIVRALLIFFLRALNLRDIFCGKKYG